MYKDLLISSLSASSGLFLLYLIAKYRSKKKKHVGQALFFKEELCSYHSDSKGKCDVPRCVYKNMLEMKACITEAKHTLDVCLYILTAEEMAVEILRAHRRNVRVRFITDAGMAMSNGSKFETLRRNGLPFRLHSTPYIMHHKFIIIDDQLLMMGSLNWTMQSIFGNWDNVLMCTESGLVQEYKETFNEMWDILSALR